MNNYNIFIWVSFGKITVYDISNLEKLEKLLLKIISNLDDVGYNTSKIHLNLRKINKEIMCIRNQKIIELIKIIIYDYNSTHQLRKKFLQFEYNDFSNSFSKENLFQIGTTFSFTES